MGRSGAQLSWCRRNKVACDSRSVQPRTSVTVHGSKDKGTLPTLPAEAEQGCSLWAHCTHRSLIAQLMLPSTMECEVAHSAESQVAWPALEHLDRRTDILITFVAPWTEARWSADSSGPDARRRSQWRRHSVILVVRVTAGLQHAIDLRWSSQWRRHSMVLVLRRGEKRRLVKLCLLCVLVVLLLYLCFL